MKSVSESKGTWHQIDVQTTHSQHAAAGMPLHVGDFSSFPRSGQSVSLLSPGHYESEAEYQQRKQAARTNSSVPSVGSNRHQDPLQIDSHAIKTSVIFNTPRLPGDFAGLESSARASGDCRIAAGPSHLAVITNTAWAVFDKTGQQQQCIALADWFSSVVTDVNIFNPGIIYDQFCGRWMIIACGRGFAGKSSCFLLSVSQTRNPLGAWWNWVLDAESSGTRSADFLADSLGTGLDNSALYLTANMFDAEGNFQYAKLRILSKTELLSGGVPQWRDCHGLSNPDGTPVFGLQPAYTFGTPGIEYLLNTTSAGQSLTQWRLTEPLSPLPQLASRTIPVVSYHMAPDAPQPGSSVAIATGDTRLVNVVFRNGSLWTAHTVAANWGEPENAAAIQWFQINTGAGVITQQRIYGHPSAAYFCPTVMLDGRSNLIMVFNRASKTEYPSIRFTGRLSTDLPGQLHASVPLRESDVPGRHNWGSYNGAAVDPNDTRIWVIGQYPVTESEFGTWIGETSYMSGTTEGRNNSGRLVRV